MNVLEFSQITFNIIGSLTFFIFIVMILAIGLSVLKVVKSIRSLIEEVKQELGRTAEKLHQIADGVSKFNIMASIAKMFKSKKRK